MAVMNSMVCSTELYEQTLNIRVSFPLYGKGTFAVILFRFHAESVIAES